MGVRDRARERRGFDDFYRAKWADHDGLWAEAYPPDQRVYAVSVYDRRNEEIVRAAGSGDRALDLGCGVGDVSLLLASRGFRVQAVDASAENVRRARSNLRSHSASADVTQADAERLPFGDATFDLVVLADVIEHVSSVGQAMREVRRVLRPGGRLVCVTPVRATLAGWRLADRMARAIVRPNGPSLRDAQVREHFLSKRELRQAISANGLRPVAFRRVCFYPAPETAGAFGGLMRHWSRRSPERFDHLANRALGVFDALARLRFLNQKQFWVAER